MQAVRLLFLSCILFFSAFAESAAIEGTVKNIGQKNYLVLNDHAKPYTVSTTSKEILNTLSHLSSEDYLVGEGKINVLSQNVRLLAIKYVGLKQLVGHWRSLSGELFHFKNFNTLNYTSKKITNDQPPAQRTIRYHVTPNFKNNSWPILFTDNFSSGSGQIRLGDNKVLVTLFDLSGYKSREITLYKSH